MSFDISTLVLVETYAVVPNGATVATPTGGTIRNRVLTAAPSTTSAGVNFRVGYPTASLAGNEVKASLGFAIHQANVDISTIYWQEPRAVVRYLSNAQIKAQYEANADTNVLTDDEKALVGNTNLFTDAEKVLLGDCSDRGRAECSSGLGRSRFFF